MNHFEKCLWKVEYSGFRWSFRYDQKSQKQVENKLLIEIFEDNLDNNSKKHTKSTTVLGLLQYWVFFCIAEGI